MTREGASYEGTHRLLFFFQWCVVFSIPTSAHVCVLVCTGPGGGLSSRQELEEARGRPHATSRRGREEMEKTEEIEIPKPLVENRRGERWSAEEEKGEVREGVPGEETGEKV